MKKGRLGIVVVMIQPSFMQQAWLHAKLSLVAILVGLDFVVYWRTKGFQQRLFDDAVRTYGSVETAQQFVASPDTSRHVVGQAVDVGPADADNWLIRNGSRFGLCQIYANEIWHFELAADQNGNCPPLRANAAG